MSKILPVPTIYMAKYKEIKEIFGIPPRGTTRIFQIGFDQDGKVFGLPKTVRLVQIE